MTVIDRSRTPLALINITALVAPSTTEDVSASSVIVTTNKREKKQFIKIYTP